MHGKCTIWDECHFFFSFSPYLAADEKGGCDALFSFYCANASNDRNCIKFWPPTFNKLQSAKWRGFCRFFCAARWCELHFCKRKSKFLHTRKDSINLLSSNGASLTKFSDVAQPRLEFFFVQKKRRENYNRSFFSLIDFATQQQEAFSELQ